VLRPPLVGERLGRRIRATSVTTTSTPLCSCDARPCALLLAGSCCLKSQVPSARPDGTCTSGIKNSKAKAITQVFIDTTSSSLNRSAPVPFLSLHCTYLSYLRLSLIYEITSNIASQTVQMQHRWSRQISRGWPGHQPTLLAANEPARKTTRHHRIPGSSISIYDPHLSAPSPIRIN
jgi:hypothetical protein